MVSHRGHALTAVEGQLVGEQAADCVAIVSSRVFDAQRLDGRVLIGVARRKELAQCCRFRWRRFIRAPKELFNVKNKLRSC